MNDASYAAAQEGIARFRARDGAEVGELGRSLVFDRGYRTRRATLLLHGLSASPAQMIGIARALHERGHNVFVPRLPQHGHADRMSRALAGMTVTQLKACLRDSLEIADGLGEEVSVAGFSLGALLAACAGQSEPLRKVVAIVPYLGILWMPTRFGEFAARVALRLPNRFYWWDPWLREKQLPAHGYPQYSTHALAQGLILAYELMGEARAGPPAAKELIVAINVREPAVSNRAAVKLADLWKAHGANVRVERFRDLPFAHDVIEPKRYPDIALRLQPRLIDLIDG
ncbi:MAG TPA: alpha/beta fold hydrolase [Candidatus Rubrimentiphilum sp.]|nr:alpha/beta fold hydrolase [Candidatus Rubrimentiphilum sp.]